MCNHLQTFTQANNYLYHYWVSCSNASSKLRIEISAKGYSYLFKEVATTQNNNQQEIPDVTLNCIDAKLANHDTKTYTLHHKKNITLPHHAGVCEGRQPQ